MGMTIRRSPNAQKAPEFMSPGQVKRDGLHPLAQRALTALTEEHGARGWIRRSVLRPINI